MRDKDEQVKELVSRLVVRTQEGSAKWEKTSQRGVFRLDGPGGTVLLKGGAIVSAVAPSLKFLDSDGKVVAEAGEGPLASLDTWTKVVSPGLLQQLYDLVDQQLNEPDPSLQQFLDEF